MSDDLPFGIEHMCAFDADKFEKACQKFHDKNVHTDRIRAIVLTSPGEAHIRCRCGSERFARSRPAGRTGQLAGSMRQVWNLHMQTCSFGKDTGSTRATDGGMPLFYAREFPIDARKLLNDLTDFTLREYDVHAIKLRPYFIDRGQIRHGFAYCIVSGILHGHIPVRAECISEDNIADVILENVEERERLLREARALVTAELDKLLPPAPESWERCGPNLEFGTVKRRPVPHNKKEGERALQDALFAALDDARTKHPNAIKCMCEHALVVSDHRLALPLVSRLLHAEYLSDAFDDALEARLRKHMRELRNTA
jgi:hypothetical protein